MNFEAFSFCFYRLFRTCLNACTLNTSVFCTVNSPEMGSILQPSINNIPRWAKSYLRVEPFAVLFWALAIVLAHILQQVTQPASLVSLNCSTGTALYGSGKLGSTWQKTRRPLHFFHLAVLFVYDYFDFIFLQNWNMDFVSIVVFVQCLMQKTE